MNQKCLFMKKFLLVFFIFLSLFSTGYSQYFQLRNLATDTAGWRYGASRSYGLSFNNDTLVLNTSHSSENNYIYQPNSVSLNGTSSVFRASFDFRIDSNYSCSDGLSFWFFTSSLSRMGDTRFEGGSMGFPDTVAGFTLAMKTISCVDDIYVKKINSNSYRFSTSSGSSAGDTNICTPLRNQMFLTDSQWHHCDITYNYGNIVVSYDSGATVMSGYKPIVGVGRFGFMATNGAGYSRKCLKNITIESSNASFSPAMLSFGTILTGTTSSAQITHINAAYLSPATGFITVTAPSGFLVSRDGTTFASSDTIAYSASTISSRTVYVKFSPTTSAIYSDTIRISGGGISGATNLNVNGEGTTVVCSGAPSAGTAISSTLFADSTTNIRLTDTGYTRAVGITFQWQSSLDSTTWTNISGATSVIHSFRGISMGTYYRLNVTCASGGTSSSVPTHIMYYGACTGTPTPGTAVATTTTCTACTFLLGVSGYSFSSGITLQWQKSTDSVTWSDIAGATSSSSIYVPYSDFYYRCKVRCTNSGMVSYTNILHTSFQYQISAHSVLDTSTTGCSVPVFYTQCNGNSSSLYLKTYYGDGNTDSLRLTGTTSSSLTVNHTYSAAGVYTIKSILYNNNIPQDTIVFSYSNYNCRTIPIKFYLDANSNCMYDAGTDVILNVTSTVAIDSNGVTIDTVSITGGLYYKAYGNPGDVYSIRVLSLSGSMTPTCPATGIIYDTLRATGSGRLKYMGVACGSSGASGYDLKVNAVIPVTGTRDQWANIYVQNRYCAPIDGTLTLNYSPKYRGTPTQIRPSAASVSGTNIIWNLTGISSTAARPIQLHYEAEHGSVPLTIRDTVHSLFTLTPMGGDIDSNNNVEYHIDTVKAGCDPNAIWVKPEGCFASGVVPINLKYIVNFENTGNDTAHNIHVMDTLSDNVDPRSLRIEMSSHEMYVSKLRDSMGRNIIKFDFPKINLLDTSHHGECDGAFIFTINTRPGLPLGANIMNRVGIYFDVNEVVMTNEVNNNIGCPIITNVENVSSSDEASIYPNPTYEELTISTQQNAYTTCSIINCAGQIVLHEDLKYVQTKLNIKYLPMGVYTLTLKGKHNVKVLRLVKL